MGLMSGTRTKSNPKGTKAVGGGGGGTVRNCSYRGRGLATARGVGAGDRVSPNGPGGGGGTVQAVQASPRLIP